MTDKTYPISEEQYKEFWDALEEDVDMVNKPPHYNKGGIETIDYIATRVPDPYSANYANAIKYLDRHLDKGRPIQDLEKCKWYIDKMIKDHK